MDAILRRIHEIEEKPHPKFPGVFVRQMAVTKETERLSAGIVRIIPGAELFPHTHEVLEVFHILEGHGMALVNGERIEVRGGEVVIAPIGNEHGLINIGERDIVLYAVFSPGIA